MAMSASIDLNDIVKVVNSLRKKLPLSWIKVKVFYKIYGGVGRNISYVRPCYECYEYERD